MKTTQRFKLILGATASVVIVCLVSGCASVQNHRQASVVSYLYPNKSEPIDKPAVPTLALPMDVGLVFVPEDASSRYSRVPFTEKQKVALLREIGSQFKQYPFVRSIQLIPTQYLRPGGSFANLEQVRTMFGTDTIALLSYDQVQFTDPGMQQLLYWTPMGPYLFKGERNDTSTLIDAAVYHIPSKTMLFRAPGTSQIKRSAAIAYQETELRTDSDKGFFEASTNLVTNLQEELQVFKEKIKTAPQDYKVEAKQGYDLKAVGKLDGRWLLVLAVIAGAAFCPRPNRTS